MNLVQLGNNEIRRLEQHSGQNMHQYKEAVLHTSYDLDKWDIYKDKDNGEIYVGPKHGCNDSNCEMTGDNIRSI